MHTLTIHTYTCTHNTHTLTHMCTHTQTHTNIHAHTLTCTHTLAHSHMHTHRLSCVFSFIPLIASIISTAALCTAGVAGNLCGPYANLTGIVDNVFDNPATWNNTYPLGAVFVNDPHYPFTVKSLLEGCHANQSLYAALRQNLRYNDKVGTSVTIPDQLAVSIPWCPGSIPCIAQ